MIRIENRFQLKQVRAECQAETKQEKCRVLICGSMNLNGVQLPEYKNGGWSIPAEDDQVAVIHTLTIHPDRAGQGLARQMVAFAEDTARSQGKTVMRFDTGVSNAVSNHLYPVIGYRFAGTVDTFFMGYVHCPLNLYEKKL